MRHRAAAGCASTPSRSRRAAAAEDATLSDVAAAPVAAGAAGRRGAAPPRRRRRRGRGRPAARAAARRTSMRYHGELPPRRRKVERVLVAERPVELRSERVEDDVDLVDDGDGAAPDGEELHARVPPARGAPRLSTAAPPWRAAAAERARRGLRPSSLRIPCAMDGAARVRARARCRARWRSSSSLSMNALTAAGVDTITARSSTAECASCRGSASLTSERRSKAKVHTGFCSGPMPKTPRITCSEKRAAARGRPASRAACRRRGGGRGAARSPSSCPRP